MIIRQAQIKDAASIAQINITTWKQAYASLLPHSFLKNRNLTDERIQKIEQQIQNQQHIMLVAEIQNQVIGYLIGGLARDKDFPFTYELYAFYVLPQYQHQYIGQALFDAFNHQIKHQPFYAYMLKGNTPAQNFYLRNGGVELTSYERPIPDPKLNISEVLFAFNQ